MQRISRAPELSATLSLALLLDHRPRSYFAFSRISVRRQCLVFDIGRVSIRRTVSPGAGLVALVVGVVHLRAPDHLLVGGVPAGALDLDGDRLVHLVGDDDALADLRVAGLALGLRPGAGALAGRPWRAPRRGPCGSGCARRPCACARRAGRSMRSSSLQLRAGLAGVGGALAPAALLRREHGLGLVSARARPSRRAPARLLGGGLLGGGLLLGRSLLGAGLLGGLAGVSSAACSSAGSSPRLSRPVFGLLVLLLQPSLLQFLLEVDAALAGDGQQPGDVAAAGPQAGAVLELAGRVAQAQVERLTRALP